MANPAILSKNTNYLAGHGQTGLDSGNILAQATAGVPPQKLTDGTQMSATSLACSQDAGQEGNAVDGMNQNSQGGPAGATITNIALTSNVLTVSCTNTFAVGMNVILSGLTTNTFLNRANLVILTVSGSQFTAAYTHGNVISGSDTGTAVYTVYTAGSGLSYNRE
jgi:hypothetical protein